MTRHQSAEPVPGLGRKAGDRAADGRVQAWEDEGGSIDPALRLAVEGARLAPQSQVPVGQGETP